ncbi:MAG: zinc ribbon domain-containing protein [Gaiellales bacterium]
MAGLWPFGRGRSAGTAAGEAPRQASHPGAVKRERRALLREREERLRDLGGLVFEMFRRDRFRVELVTERCADLVALEQRLDELDSLVAAATSRSGLRCACGAPLAWGAHFCANCGRSAGPRPVVSCARCGSPLPADVQFCGRCGSAVETQSPEVPADTQPDPKPKEPAEV